MGRKLGLTSLLFRTRGYSKLCPPSPWPWPSCNNPKTHSFRASGEGACAEAVVSARFEPTEPESLISTASEESAEAVLRGLRSDRLFFEPGGGSSSIVEAAKAPFTGSVAVVMESADPYEDFRASMEEVVVAYGVRDWGRLEEMLGWYLRANAKRVHGLIVGAFMDLLLGLASSPSPFSHSSFSSSSTSTCTFEIDEDDHGNGS